MIYKNIFHLDFILFALSFILITHHVCLTNTLVELGTQIYFFVIAGCYKRLKRRNNFFAESLI
jgi:hypothetical protein